MKKIIRMLGIGCVMLALSACQNGSQTTTSSAEETQSEAVTETENSTPGQSEESSSTEVITSVTDTGNSGKALVVYFSATGNTETVADLIAQNTGADLYEIVPEQPYSAEDLNYNDNSSRTNEEHSDSAFRPAISGSVEDMDQYDVVYIGYPIWWGEAPQIVSTFIESYDFSGKTLVAFCTSGSSGFGSSDAALKSATPDATWLQGSRFGSNAADTEISEWLDSLAIGN